MMIQQSKIEFFEQSNITKVFINLADKLMNGTFPIEDVPVQNVQALLMEIFRGYSGSNTWVLAKVKMLLNYIEQNNNEGCALFFYELAHVSHMMLLLACRERSYITFRDKMLNDRSNNQWFNGKGVVYTVLTGNYESLKEPEFINPEFDYICFTDSKQLKSECWSICELTDLDGIGVQRLSRKPKMLVDMFLDQYDFSIYVDSKFRIRGDLFEYVNKYSMGAPMLCFSHYARDCVYDEAKACISLKKESKDIICEQIDRYKVEKFPEHYGLIDAGCMVRSHRNGEVIKVMHDWWKEFLRGGRRDQISFPYVCWKNDFKYDICGLFINDNEYIIMER